MVVVGEIGDKEIIESVDTVDITRETSTLIWLFVFLLQSFSFSISLMGSVVQATGCFLLLSSALLLLFFLHSRCLFNFSSLQVSLYVSGENHIRTNKAVPNIARNQKIHLRKSKLVSISSIRIAINLLIENYCLPP